MTRQIPWNKQVVEAFIKDATLTKEEELVLRTRVNGWTRLQQAHELGMSVATVDRIIRRLKLKYDQVQGNNELLPPRAKNSNEIRRKLIK